MANPITYRNDIPLCLRLRKIETTLSRVFEIWNVQTVVVSHVSSGTEKSSCRGKVP